MSGSHHAAEQSYFCMDFGRLPDELYHWDVPLEAWQKHLRTAGPDGFPPGSLSEVSPIPTRALAERLVTFPFYMMLNAAPFLVPPLVWVVAGLRGCATFLATVLGTHVALRAVNPMGHMRQGQFLYTERNTQKYNSTKWVWPKSLQPPNTAGPKIFCTIPHGLAPVGITAYPGWSRLFGDHLCRCTAAPVVLNLPIVSYFLRMVGYIPAGSKEIKKALADGQHVHLVLDGIEGMFRQSQDTEIGRVRERKGIVKIALTTGAPLVPVFAFGHSSLWRVVVDPFGILEAISTRLGVSVVPFFGRPFGLLPLGPPYRVPVLMAFGDPICVPKTEQPSQAQIDEYHAKLMEGYSQAFEKHKVAYGRSALQLRLE